MYLHKSGYHHGHETVSTHCRRRYRLTPGPNPNPNLPPCDPALWIVHYTRTDVPHQFPVARLPVNPQTQHTIQQRRYLQSQGQLVRKEFMLDDREHWPQVHLPQQGQHMAGYPGNVISHLNRSQQQAYMQDPHAAASHGPSPAKRPRQNPPAQRPGSSPAPIPGAVALHPTIEEEDDYARGDYMDMITPREISSNRYKKHHEWMEEIYSSPFANGQIIPVELGLGRKGELEALTRGFFEAPIGGTPISKQRKSPDPPQDPPTQPKVPGLGPGKAEEFTKRATEKIAEINADMAKMKELHAKRMAKLRQGSLVRDAERRLRSAVTDPRDNNNTNPIPPSENDIMAAGIRQQGRVDEIAEEVERALHRKIEVVHQVKCVQKGGLEEKVPPEISEFSDALPSTSSAAMLDAPITEPAQPDDVPAFPEFDDKADWMQPDPDVDPVPESLDIGDTSLQHTNNVQTSEPATNLETHNQNGDAGDWVMVDRQDDANAARGDVPQLNNLDAPTGDETDLDKLGTELPDFSADVPDLNAEGFEANDFDDTVDFGNLDTAGEALAGYEPNDGMETDEHVGLLDDSAFGDAFHHTEANMEGNGEGGSA